MKQKTIWTSENKMFRIIEQLDDCFDMENLKGDMFNHAVCPEVDIEVLKKQESDFERKVENDGVFGYSLETWDAAPGVGWTHVDSCWGFIGQYDSSSEEFGHYIVDELKSRAKSELALKTYLKDRSNLIAAAPEMLEALESVLARLVCDWPSFHSDIKQQLNAAIKKAKGK